jgi:hypothetical protein
MPLLWRGLETGEIFWKSGVNGNGRDDKGGFNNASGTLLKMRRDGFLYSPKSFTFQLLEY